MAAIIKTEFLKVKRYYILWAGVGLMFLSVLLTLFTSTANDGTVWDFAYLTEQVIKNNMTMTFPMCITLIAGYIISREWTDDTIKNILTVPISFKRLLTGKLVLCGALALLFGIVSTLFTILAEMLVKFPGFTFPLVMQAFFQITMECFFLYLAVMPIIVLTSRVPGSFLVGVIVAFVYGYGGIFAAGSMTLSNIYPVTACLGLIGYRSYDKAVTWNLPICLLSIFLIVGISVILIIAGKDKEPKKVKRNKEKQPARKKGW